MVPRAPCIKACIFLCRPQHARHSESFKKRTQHRQIEQGQRDALDRTAYELNERVQARWRGGRALWDGTVTAISNTRPKTYTITYDDGDVDEEVPLNLILPAPAESTQKPSTQQGLALRTTDQRFPWRHHPHPQGTTQPPSISAPAPRPKSMGHHRGSGLPPRRRRGRDT